MRQPVPKIREHLSADALHRTLKEAFQQIPDHRPTPDISLPDALLAGFALFSLKDPSLLAFEDLQAARMNFIWGVKPGDHAFLFERWIEAHNTGRVTIITTKTAGGGECEISLTHDLPLNASHPDLRVNFLQLIETDADGNIVRQFTWVTDLVITPENAAHLARGGRARWKVTIRRRRG
jgi:hypothetical protein